MLTLQHLPLLADGPSVWFPFAILGTVLIFSVSAIILTVYVFRSWESVADQRLKKLYAGLKIHHPPECGDILISYHTYHGILFWVSQRFHVASLPPQDARIFLGRLLRFNLTFGALAQGGMLVVPLAVFNYFVQRKSIGRQQTQNELAVLQVSPKGKSEINFRIPPDLKGFLEQQKSPSVILQATGWICAATIPLFAAVTVGALVNGEIKGSLGGVFLIAVFAWIANDWTRPRVFTSLYQLFRKRRFAACSFCRGKLLDVGPLLEGHNAYICANCCLAAASRLDTAFVSGTCCFCEKEASCELPVVSSPTGVLICPVCLESGLGKIELERAKHSSNFG